MPDLFEANLAALARRSPETAERIRHCPSSEDIHVVTAASGAPVLERGGLALDSRRDPARAASRALAGVTAARVVVAGLGGGYLAEALVDRGVEVAAIVDASPGVVAAALRARPLASLLERTPLVLVGPHTRPLSLAELRHAADTIVPHGPSVTASPELAALVAGWPSIRTSSRPPRVLVAGPIYGGSLDIARMTARAAAACGASVTLFDASCFREPYERLPALGLGRGAAQVLQDRIVSIAGEAIVALAAAWKPDLLIALAQAPLGCADLAAIARTAVATAFWFVENHRVLPYWRTVGPRYDWFYAIQNGAFLEALADAGCRRPRYLPVACDPERHRPVDLTADERGRFGADVSFAGAPYLNRRHVFGAIADTGLRLWGAGWNDPALGPLAAEGGRAFSIDEMVRIFAATRININLHSASHVTGLDPDPDYVNPRTFELASCGAFQLTDRRDPLPDLFASDEVVTFSSVVELRDLIGRFRAHPDEAADTARRARRRALADHTYAHRIRSVLDETLQPELAAAARAGIQPDTLDGAILRLQQASPALGREEALLSAVREVRRTWVDRP